MASRTDLLAIDPSDAHSPVSMFRQSTDETQLSIIIVNWNTRDLMNQCLTSIADEARRLGNLNVETFVVDNASTDGSTQMVRERFPWVRLIENKQNVGFARANNQAIHQSHGRYVLLLNSDTKVLSGALGTLVAFMDTHPEAGAIGARLLNADGSLQQSCYPMLTPWGEFWRLTFLDRLIRKATYNMKTWDVQTPKPVDVMDGACLLLRREALEQVGLLDELYFFYTEEVDLCYRLAKAGWQLWWVPAAKIVHYGGASSRQMAERMYLELYRTKIQFYRKFRGERQANGFKHLLRLAYWPRLVAASIAAPFSTSLRAQACTWRRLLSELKTM